MSDFDRTLRAAQAGDEEAFVRLFRGVQPVLLRYLTALGGPLAEDAAADAWVNVVRGLKDFSGDEAGWRAWVLTIGRARLVDAQRRAARTPIPVDVEDELADRAAADDVLAAAQELVSTEAAVALVRRLPQDQAEAVLLRHLAGLDVATAARVLGKTPAAVRVCTHRGLRRLADLLARDGGEGARGPSPQRSTRTSGDGV